MILAFGIVLVSSLFQALYYVLVKGSPKTPTIILSNLFGGLLFMVSWIFVWKDLGQIVHILHLILFSGISNAIIFYLTIHIYRNGGDISYYTPIRQAYTIISSTLLSLIICFFTNTDIHFAYVSLIGFGVTIIGCLLLPLIHINDFNLKNYFNKMTFYYLLTGFFASLSMCLDSTSVHTLSGNINSIQKALIFIVPFRLATVVGIIPFLWWDKKKYGIDFTQEKPDIKQAFIMGFSLTVAYILVCISYQYVSDPAFIACFRLLAIPLASIGGFIIYKEKIYFGKIAGSILMVGGLALITLG